MYDFLRNSKTSSKYQFGFWRSYSLTEMLRNTLDDNEFACGVLQDLQKVFDTANNDTYLLKLKHF